MRAPEARGKAMYLKLKQYTPGSMRLAGKAVTSLHEPPPQPVGPPDSETLRTRIANTSARGKPRHRVCGDEKGFEKILLHLPVYLPLRGGAHVRWAVQPQDTQELSYVAASRIYP